MSGGRQPSSLFYLFCFAAALPILPKKERKEEKAENKNTVAEAKAGLAAVKMAIDILDKFYKTSAKAKVPCA